MLSISSGVLAIWAYSFEKTFQLIYLFLQWVIDFGGGFSELPVYSGYYSLVRFKAGKDFLPFFELSF
jgi:hypothetical protein